MGTVVKVALGVLIGGLLLLGACAALILGSAGVVGGGQKDRALEDDEPARSPQRTRRFSGKGAKNVGTVKVTDDAVLSWKAADDGHGNRRFAVTDQDFKINIHSSAANGRSSLEPGTYRRVDVNAVDDWSFTVKGR